MRLLLQLDDDSLLFPIRKLQGMPTPGISLAGWYAADGFAPAHCFGQWISALARYYAATGDDAARAKVQRIVALHAETLQPNGKFFRDNHFPAYTYDKILLGLMDAHTLTRDPLAWNSMQRLTDTAAPWLPQYAIARDELCGQPRDPIHYCIDESYTLGENQFLAFKLTHDPRYLARGRRMLVNKQFFDPLSRGQNALINQHAYSHMNALSSGAQAYLTLGDDKYLRAVTNAFTMVLQQSYATGGWGPEEAFVDPATDRLAEDMTKTHRGFETPCGSYAHLKLARYLMQITGDSAYGDSMERVLYNTIAGALPLQSDGRAFYYSDYAWQASKTYFPDRWPCCAGTLPMVASDFGISAYFRDAQGVFVNLYIPSTLQFTTSNGTRVALAQSGTYPHANEVVLKIETSRPTRFAVRLRIPAWAAGAEIFVNGKPAGTVLEPGTFAAITREWKTGDRIEMTLPLPMRTEPLSPQHPEIVALLRGPICLFAVRENAQTVQFNRTALMGAQPAQANSQELLAQPDTGAPLRLKPFPTLKQDEPNSLYLKV